MIEGIITKGIGGFYYIDTNQGIYECRARGIFRKNKITPLVGDNVKISIVDEENKKGVLEEIKERETELVRPPISNVNKAIIVFAIKNPNPNLSLLDRFIVLAERECLDIVIVLTKADLATDEELENLKRIYEMSGYKVIPVSNNENLNIDKVKEELKGNIVVFAGPSGVGKSTLLNHIDSKFQLQTGEVSDKIKRGKHTTRHAELLKLECGGMVADTPGFSSLTLDDIEETELKEYFIEFDEFSDECKFGGRCMHENEPSCGIKEAVKDNKISKERYESYLQLLNEKRQGKRRY
ncbi:Putative ribosome biogenesis GTPase RsgA [uncultured Clostridium sp.]|uniref:Small ribosomal subunit biogenesis GTPase RsgA n=1 Tax=Paeniclostridium hominis TaxID=2764329 RepID=A0ABR7K4C6_9FIRM|nr:MULTISPECIES: ribosome small subunit-dependent GTPase A [Paeniclostridium]MDU1538806.1 ribosome small subunit-dependent GTPase A [Paeniclostridium sordellii]SCI73564.1 Putative ribosome biogenesis GTPase RsgA [uncultured Clostridium sp.]MBC6003963.1 ribosome small subunit-dependent GTPase A [Paeniclostridium hominis]MDU2591536.1 ribosome small subunit-dependent GTPase A [Paeniclostridium sordellii]SCJ12592.1 Putative ribosome biogenesis GTPase RsgA [uncultured Clostridium sp.]